MADRWFEIASVDHFWFQRRFDVLRSLADNTLVVARELAEIGCGNGLLQRQIEDAYDREVTGFDLNEYGLKNNVSRTSPVCCYDIHQREPKFRVRFDVILMFDVLEHIAAEDEFVQAVLFHLAPGGKLLVHVPAGPWAFSEYDAVVGHVRRYSPRMLFATAQRNRLQVLKWSYWGLPLLPTLAIRKLWLRGEQDKSRICSVGFDSGTGRLNRVLGLAARCEVLPQKLLGTSLMAILQREKEAGASGSR
jgi:SAM-dependent methyltransferase